MRREALRRWEPQKESNQQEKEGACYGRRERRLNFGVIFQGLFQKRMQRTYFGGYLWVKNLILGEKMFGPGLLRSSMTSKAILKVVLNIIKILQG